MTDILLITEQSIKNITNISDNMAGKLLLTAIRESQEINLREILGDALLDELKRQVAENDVRETYNHLILQCQYFLAYQSCANICMITSVKIDNSGLQRVSDEKMEPLPVSEVNQIHDYYQQKADFYCERLQHYLLQHKEDYPQLNARQCNSINANLYSSATCGIFLGGPRSKGTQRDCDGMNSSKSQGVEKLDVELTENGTYDYKPKGYGFNSAHIVVNTPEIKNQEKNINITSNGHSEIVPDPEFTGMNKVDITVDVHPSERLVRTYTENGVYPIEGEYNGGEITVNIGGDVEKYKYLVNKADEDGLRQLGWNDDDINYFKYNTYVLPTDTTSYKVSAENIALKDVVVDINSYTLNKDNPNLEYLPKIDFTGFENVGSLFQNTAIKAIPYFDTSIKSDFSWFFSVSRLKTIPPINTMNGTDFSFMFYQCKQLTTIPELNTSNGTNFNSMFLECRSLSYVPELNTSNGIEFSSMFAYCSSLLYIPELNTSKCTDFNNMFAGCDVLSTIPLIDTSNGTNFSWMFSACYGLDSLPQLDFSKGTNFSYMFQSCWKIKTMPTFDISNGSNMDGMFNGCSGLINITFTGSINANISFSDCLELSYDSIKSILTACAATTNTNSKTVAFNKTIADQNNELTNLVTQCTEKGWQVTGLNITTE